MREQANFIGELGSIREAGGNKPILLDRPDKVWVVERGHVDVFSVRMGDCGPAGARQPFFTVPAGDILLGARPAANRGMLAAGTFGTCVREIDADAFLELGRDPSKADDIQRLLRRWIRNASLAAGGREAMPRGSLDLAGAGRVSAKQGAIVHPSFKTLWVHVQSGRLAFMGREDLPAVVGDHPFPLVRGTWLRAIASAELSYGEEWPSLDGGCLRRMLEAFSGFILECAAANAQRAEAAERTRMERREEAERSILQRGLSRLAFIMTPRKLPVEVEVDRGQPLLAACRMVGQSAGIEVQTEWSGKPEPGEVESLDEISRASAFRTRQVTLKANWWKRDSGPLLVWRGDGRPLAAVPASRKRYNLLDPVDGTVQTANRALAGSLADHAHVFYRSFPRVPLRGGDVVWLAVRGCSRDIGTALLAGLGGALLSLLAPWMTGLLFDSVIPAGQGGQILQLGMLLLVAATATFLFDLTRGIALLRVEGRMDSSVQVALWDRLLSLPVSFFGNYTAGDLAERSMGISTIRSILSNAVVSTVMAGLFSLANLGLLFHYSARMAWMAVALLCAGLAFILCVSLFLVRHQRRYSRWCSPEPLPVPSAWPW